MDPHGANARAPGPEPGADVTAASGLAVRPHVYQKPGVSFAVMSTEEGAQSRPAGPVDVVLIGGGAASQLAELVASLPASDHVAYLVSSDEPEALASMAPRMAPGPTVTHPEHGAPVRGRCIYVARTDASWAIADGRWQARPVQPRPPIQTEPPVRREEARIRRADRLESLGTMAAGIAHELNNALASILGFAELAREGPHRSAADLDEVIDAAHRAQVIVGRLLAFSGRTELAKQPVDVNDAVEAARQLVQRPGARLTSLHLEASPATVAADPEQLRQALLAILQRAMAPSSRAHRVGLRTANVEIGADDPRRHLGLEPGPHVQIRIEDDGDPDDASFPLRVAAVELPDCDS